MESQYRRSGFKKLKKGKYYKFVLVALDKEAKDFVGTHNFSAFCSAGTEVQDKVREIYDCTVTRNGDLVEIRVSGNGFLYNMVRIIAGTLIDIQRGKIEKGSIPEIINSLDREKAGVTVEGCGLYLDKVFYN